MSGYASRPSSLSSASPASVAEPPSDPQQLERWRRERNVRLEAQRRRRLRERREQQRAVDEEEKHRNALEEHRGKKEAYVKYLRGKLATTRQQPTPPARQAAQQWGQEQPPRPPRPSVPPPQPPRPPQSQQGDQPRPQRREHPETKQQPQQPSSSPYGAPLASDRNYPPPPESPSRVVQRRESPLTADSLEDARYSRNMKRCLVTVLINHIPSFLPPFSRCRQLIQMLRQQPRSVLQTGDRNGMAQSSARTHFERQADHRAVHFSASSRGGEDFAVEEGRCSVGGDSEDVRGEPLPGGPAPGAPPASHSPSMLQWGASATARAGNREAPPLLFDSLDGLPAGGDSLLGNEGHRVLSAQPPVLCAAEAESARESASSSSSSSSSSMGDASRAGQDPSGGGTLATAASIQGGGSYAQRRSSKPSHRRVAAAAPVKHDSRWGKGTESEVDREKRLLREKALAFAAECREKAKLQAPSRPSARALQADMPPNVPASGHLCPPAPSVPLPSEFFLEVKTIEFSSFASLSHSNVVAT